ncbi:MAG: veratrol--corrinoid protein metyltransferase, partial [Treponema sp.]|nr:veratrol--corrinoid protein metyltransferase [Treponema sp.]
MTEKENVMKALKGETPAWVPRFTFFPDPYATRPMPIAGVMPMYLPFKPSPAGGFIDEFGVEYVPTTETGGAMLPKPGVFILDDITKWRDVIKTPDLSGINWEEVAKKALENSKVDRAQSALSFGGNAGFFQQLMAFMGFNDGLIALVEEPEEVKALFEYLCDYYYAVASNLIDYLKPDIYSIGDDTATANNPFISVELFKEVIKPFHARIAKLGIERGLPIIMHDCGRCEDFIEDWRDYGVTAWNPAQVTNDLAGIKKKYGNSLVLMGCWDSQGPAGWPGAPEQLVRQAVRDVIDKYGPGGGYMFLGSTYGPVGDEELANR